MLTEAWSHLKEKYQNSLTTSTSPLLSPCTASASVASPSLTTSEQPAAWSLLWSACVWSTTWRLTKTPGSTPWWWLESSWQQSHPCGSSTCPPGGMCGWEVLLETCLQQSMVDTSATLSPTLKPSGSSQSSQFHRWSAWAWQHWLRMWAGTLCWSFKSSVLLLTSVVTILARQRSTESLIWKWNLQYFTFALLTSFRGEMKTSNMMKLLLSTKNILLLFSQFCYKISILIFRSNRFQNNCNMYNIVG